MWGSHFRRMKCLHLTCLRRRKMEENWTSSNIFVSTRSTYNVRNYLMKSTVTWWLPSVVLRIRWTGE
jgi:hypothetical protein